MIHKHKRKHKRSTNSLKHSILISIYPSSFNLLGSCWLAPHTITCDVKKHRVASYSRYELSGIPDVSWKFCDLFLQHKCKLVSKFKCCISRLPLLSELSDFSSLSAYLRGQCLPMCSKFSICCQNQVAVVATVFVFNVFLHPNITQS